VQVSALPKGVNVEISVTAYKWKKFWFQIKIQHVILYFFIGIPNW
jgi:hypothetical protein